MAITLPPELEHAFAFLGLPWPTENEDHMRECAAAYRSCGVAINSDVVPKAKGATAIAGQTNAGDHIAAMFSSIKDYAGDSGHLPNLALSLHALADVHDVAADIVEIIKKVLILAAVCVAVVLVWVGIAATVGGVGAAIAALRARSVIAAARAFAQRFAVVFWTRLERFFGSFLVRAVESRLRRILGFPPLDLSRQLTTSMPSMLRLSAVTASLAFLERPRDHPAGVRGNIHQGSATWSHRFGDYRLGPPAMPKIGFDNDFAYDPNIKPTLKDYLSWYKWDALRSGAELDRPDLADALAAYRHYRDGSGTDFQVDYEKAFREDRGVRDVVLSEIRRAGKAAEDIHQKTGLNNFQITGPAAGVESYTENWQKTLGAHRLWGSADVRVVGNRITMNFTGHVADRYNFNPNSHDNASGAPDSENGRFEALGWAKGFQVHGSIQRTISWDIGSGGPAVPDSGEPKPPEAPRESDTPNLHPNARQGSGNWYPRANEDPNRDQ